MRKRLLFSFGAIVLGAIAVFVWSHTALVSVQAVEAGAISPTEMMMNHKGSLPTEQWDAI